MHSVLPNGVPARSSQKLEMVNDNGQQVEKGTIIG